MIFLRAAQREFAQTALGVFIALLAILLTTQLIRLLGKAASGATVPEAVAALLGFAALNYLPVLLSLTLFVSVLLSLSRSYRDSEMAIWFSSGVSLVFWAKPVLRFAWPVVLAIALLAFFLSPWALNKRTDYQHRIDQRGDVARLTPGAFSESSRGDRVFFVESVPEGNNETVRNIFVSSLQHGRAGVTVAPTGRTETAPNGDKFMVLLDGRRYESTSGQTDYRVVEFSSYAMRIEAADDGVAEKSAKHLSTLELLGNPTSLNKGELLWRIGVPVSALVLSLLAIPLSFVNPRAGRTNNLIFALLTFMIYSNLLSVSQAWVAQGRISFAVGVWAVHALMIVFMFILFGKRLTVFSPWRLLRRED